MNETTQKHLKNLWSADRALQNEAFFHIIAVTNQPVDWAYEVWDTVVANLTHKDNHNGAIAAQLLCNLAKSDPEKRILKDFLSLLQVTRDERFVTARHCLQALWKVGTAGAEQQETLLAGLEQRYHECVTEKNATLIRFDIIQGLRNLYDVNHDNIIKDKALTWIEGETDPKYRKKYTRVWKDA